MGNTVIGVYDSYTQAQNAMNELLSSGFAPDDVQLNPEQEMSVAATASGSEPHESRIGHFFRSLFGMEEKHPQRDAYMEAVRRGSCVLTVNAELDEQRDRATEIMNRYDPVDIEERSTFWRSQGWSGYDDSIPVMSEEDVLKERASYAQSRDSDSMVNMQQNRGQAGQPRAGVQVYQRAGETPAYDPSIGSIDDDDADFRRHWQSAYGQSGGRYEDYDAAYRYGTTLSATERFKSYRWEDVEPDLRNDWESSHPGSTWDKVKDAVRYGAQRVKDSIRH
ncbi:hypothetical protein D3870_17770 [Noviherbaspirillum cavernae]|uniref:Heat induced stress protein YflT n=1 Tax=Noviherbaspirillum cavernae TaxID=2320862 RepID=A0A418X5D0_9BURK|nr:hypothetical protein [Noviherbaspirillum cavernae]RJG07596.1 hypothetical protein D3870_17770 [Noviherbaspirillum cavernae]